MKLVDTNVLLYAVDDTSPQHGAIRPWLEEALSETETTAFAWNALLGFLRLSTNPRVFTSPLSSSEALEIVSDWLAQPATTVLHPTRRHAAVLGDLLQPLGTAGNLTSDAHLAALAIEHGAVVCSTDDDFRRFAGVEVHNPLRS